MRIVISEFMDNAAVAELATRFDVCYDKDLVDRPGDLAMALADADALIVRNRTSVDAALLASASRLRVVGRLGVGLDNLDMKACAARGIDVPPATVANALARAWGARRAGLEGRSAGGGSWPRRPAAAGAGRGSGR